MRLKGLFEDRRFLYVVIFLILYSLIILGINLYLFAGNNSPTNVNDTANVISILIVSIFAIRLWISNRKNVDQNRIWGLLALGSVSWVFAESIWLYLSLRSPEMPYPSAADYFWIFGYIPFSAAFILRRGRYRIASTPLQRNLNILVAALFILAVGVFIIWPIMTTFDPTKIDQDLLNIAYPVADVILSILVLNIFFSTQTGRFSVTWRLLAFSFLVLSVSDLMFSYTDSIGIYYPNGQPNAISIALDVLYNDSYLLMAVGVFAFSLILEMDRGVRKGASPTSLTKSSILIFVDTNLRIISFSKNFLSHMNDQDKQKYEKAPLSQALGIDPETETAIRKEALAQGSVSNKPLVIKTADGTQKDAWLTAVAIRDHENQFTNLGIVLRTNQSEMAGEEAQPTDEQQGLIDHYLTLAGTQTKEEKEILQDYYLELIRLFYSIVRQFSGHKVADGLTEHLDQIAEKKGWQVTHVGQEIKISQEYDARTMAEAMSVLLQEGRHYAVDASSAEIVDEEIRIVDQSITPDAIRSLNKFELRTAVSG